MSADIGGRPVLRPAGNVARTTLRKATKPPHSPVKPQVVPLSPRISPPNTFPSTHKTAISSPARNLLVKPLSPSKLCHKKPSPSPISLNQAEQQLSEIPLPLASDGCTPDLPDVGFSCKTLELGFNGSPPLAGTPLGSPDGASASPLGCTSAIKNAKPLLDECPPVHGGGNVSSPHVLSLSESVSKALPTVSKTSRNVSHPMLTRSQNHINSHIALNKSTSDALQKVSRSNVKAKSISTKSLSKSGSLSFDESSLATMVAAKKAAVKEVNAQRKLKVSEYGRKQGKVSRIVPDVSTALLASPVELKRCKFITAQSDPVYVAYHDQEWGVPIHDDRILFELLVLAGFQVELSWATILQNREAYREVFAGFDPSVIALFKEKHIQSLEADRSLGLPAGKIRGVVENARRVLEMVHEFGSIDEYMWGFLNKQPMINNFRYPKQVPVKTSKAESISKDLVKRGFRFVGPTIVYSFMQASGMTNDHLVQCFRHLECMKLSSPSGELHEGKLEAESRHEDKDMHMVNLEFNSVKEAHRMHLVERGCACEQDECSKPLEACTAEES